MNNIEKKITLYLLSKKGLDVLTYLIESKKSYLIKNIVVGIDKNVQNDYSSDIINLCKNNNLDYYFKKDQFEEGNFIIAISWRWLIHTKNYLIVFHDSLLPKYRGFAPLVNALINQEKFVGVTALKASDNYDEGDIILQESIPILYPIKIENAIENISALYKSICLKIFNLIETSKEFSSYVQENEKASYSLWRDEEDYKINWNLDSQTIQQFIYSLGYPYKGASSLMNGSKVRIIDCTIETDVNIENRDVGKVIFMKDKMPVVVCGKGLLLLTKILDDNNNELYLNSFRTRFE